MGAKQKEIIWDGEKTRLPVRDNQRAKVYLAEREAFKDLEGVGWQQN